MSEIEINEGVTGPLSEADKELLNTPETPPEGETPPQGEQTPEEKTPEEQGAEDALKIAGLDLSEFQTEWNSAGGLGDESYQKLEMAGFSKDVVDTFIAGVQAKQGAHQTEEALVADIKEYAGGEDEYMKMVQWAKGVMPAKDQDAYNAILATGDATKIKWAVDALKARYRNTVGTRGKFIDGDASPGATSKDVFKSTAEVTQAMRDPRYKNDKAYVDAVAEKLGRSNVFLQK